MRLMEPRPAHDLHKRTAPGMTVSQEELENEVEWWTAEATFANAKVTRCEDYLDDAIRELLECKHQLELAKKALQ